MKKFLIEKDSKCLIVAPHPDDEVIGCGGLLIDYAKNFDCICIGSSGLANPEKTIGAKKRSDIRIAEFQSVMRELQIKNFWIFPTYGIPHFDKQILAHLKNYLEVLKTKNYDYIFLPHPKDGHHEHRLITNYLFKLILKKNGFKNDCKIVFYEVWSKIKKPNYFYDISSIINKKLDLISKYESQCIYVNYVDRTQKLNAVRGESCNLKYAEVYRISSVKRYLSFFFLDKLYYKIRFFFG